MTDLNGDVEVEEVEEVGDAVGDLKIDGPENNGGVANTAVDAAENGVIPILADRVDDRNDSSKPLAGTRMQGSKTLLASGMSRELSSKDAAARLTDDELERTRFLLKMRDDRGLAEQEALELKELSFKFLKGEDSERIFKSVVGFSKKKLSLARLSKSGSLSMSIIEELGISEEEKSEMRALKKLKKRRDLTFDEEVKYESLRQRMVDHAYDTNLDLINEIFESEEFAMRSNSRQHTPSVTFSEPMITLTPYNENYALDLFALPHNAIKEEIRDLYTIVASIVRRTIRVEREDLEIFFEWWEDFYFFVIKIFEIEDKFMLPWVTRRVNVSNTTMQQTARNLRKSKITFMLRQVSNAKESMGKMHPGELMGRINKTVDKFTQAMFEYFSITERVLSPMISQAYSHAEKRVLDKEMYAFIRDGENASLVIGLLLRWMTERQQKEWRREILGFFEGSAFRDLMRDFNESDHIYIPSRVLDREQTVMLQK